MPNTCHACITLHHLVTVTGYNALVHSLTGHLDDTRQHAAADAVRACTDAGPHTCTTTHPAVTR